jgi:hypothetical protein
VYQEKEVFDMMAQIREATKEELLEQKRIEKLYIYYGLPYRVFDEAPIPKDVEMDWSKASLLITQGKPIPKDLEERLFRYKEETLANKKLQQS